jgi:hypothetical protein
MTTWLLRRRTSTKPWHWRIAQTSRPEKTRNLPNGHLDLGHVDLPAEPPLDLLRGSGLEK